MLLGYEMKIIRHEKLAAKILAGLDCFQSFQRDSLFVTRDAAAGLLLERSHRLILLVVR